MKKSYLIMAAIASLALVSCSDEEFVGNPELGPGQGKTAEIVFGSIGKGMTRADLTGEAAAEKLNNEFVFAGTKTQNNSYVFDQYKAKWVENTAHTTESNSSDWEYVGQIPASTATIAHGSTDYQTIKYWDYSTSQYDFAAYSLGLGAAIDDDNNPETADVVTPATATAITFADIADDTPGSYTLTGTADQLKACYISDLVTAYNKQAVADDPEIEGDQSSPAANDYGQVVTFKFRSLATKIRIAFYETVPGYAVKDIQFYSAATGGTATTTPTLFASSAVLPSGSGTMTVYFPTTGWSSRAETDYNKAHVSFAATNTSTDLSSTLTFDALAGYAPAEKNEGTASTGWIGRASNTATYPGGKQVHKDPSNENSPMIENYYTILPNEDGANLLLRIKYTLVSTDGSGETINVDNATAVVPAELATWSPNYAYTYIFKISDMTNGSTGVDGNGEIVTGLTPITLNAVVVDSEDGIQETITRVTTPSITTYSEGVVVTANNEYKTGNVIYVIVNNGTSNETLTVGTNANLYTVTLAASTDQGDNPAATPSQPISEESVENALINGTKDNDSNPTTWTVKDANQWKLTVTKVNTSLSAVTHIDKDDSPTGNQIDVTGAKFTAGDAGTIYAFEFNKGAVAAVYTQVTETGALTNGETYYTSASGDGEFVADGSQAESTGSNYWKLTTPASAAAKSYKIIKIANQ